LGPSQPPSLDTFPVREPLKHTINKGKWFSVAFKKKMSVKLKLGYYLLLSGVG
jgi:hypothetical protein